MARPKPSTTQQQHGDDRAETRAGNKARRKARNKRKARPAEGRATTPAPADTTEPTDIRARFTVRSGADGNGLPITIRPEQQRVEPQPAAAKPAKPVKSSKPSKPAKSKRARRAKRRKATSKSKSRSSARGVCRGVSHQTPKRKKSPRSPIPKFPNSHTPEPQKRAEPTAEPTKDSEKTKRTGEIQTCQGQAWRQWAEQITAKHPDAIRENLGSGWPVPNPELAMTIITAPEEIIRLAEQEAKTRGYSSLTAADFRQHMEPHKLWIYLKGYYRQNRPQTSPGQLGAFVAETVERFQSKYLRQEQFRRLDDLDDEEQRIEHDIDAALDRVVEKAARDFNVDTATIWDALIEGFRNHPKLAEIVDDVPGKIIYEAGEEFRATADPYAVWARFGERPRQAPGRIVFTWARIFKVALIPDRFSTDLDNKRPWHHFRLLKKESGRVIEREVVIPGKLVVKGSTYLPAIRFVRTCGRRWRRSTARKSCGSWTGSRRGG